MQCHNFFKKQELELTIHACYTMLSIKKILLKLVECPCICQQLKKMMFSTKQLVNSIHRNLKDKTNIVEHAEALVFWHRPIFSAIIFILVELSFFLIYISNLKKATMLSIILAVFAVLNVSQKIFPNLFDKFFSFQIPEISADATNRIRSVSEVSAYLTTMLSLWTSFIKFVLSDFSILHLIISLISLFFLTVMLTIFGDFWIVYIFFHVIFVLPGIVLHPRIYNMLFYHENEENEEEEQNNANNSTNNTDSGTTEPKNEPDSAQNEQKVKRERNHPDEELDAPPPTIQGDE